jgi:hypothetical protein
MARLPNVHGDEGEWGGVLNEFLSVGHNNDGAIKALDIPFGLAGVLTASSSPPIPVWRPFVVVSLSAALGGIATTDTTVNLARGIEIVASLTIPAGEGSATTALSETVLFNTGDTYVLSVSPGTDAANLGGAIGCQGAS